MGEELVIQVGVTSASECNLFSSLGEEEKENNMHIKEFIEDTD